MKNQQSDFSLRAAKKLGMAFTLFFVGLLIFVFAVALSQK